MSPQPAFGLVRPPSLSSYRPASIKMDLYLFQSSHALFDFVVDEGKKFLELHASVHDLYDDGQVLRQSLNLESVQPAVRPKAHHTAQHRGPRQTFFAGFEHNPFVQEFARMPVALADENTQQIAFFRKHHNVTPKSDRQARDLPTLRPDPG